MNKKTFLRFRTQINTAVAVSLIIVIVLGLVAYPRPEIYFELKSISAAWHNAEKTKSRIAALEREAGNHPFQLIIGASSTREAFAPEVPNKKIAIMAETGGTIKNMHGRINLIIDGKLSPDSVVLVINPFMLAKAQSAKDKASVMKKNINSNKTDMILKILVNPMKFKDLLIRKWKFEYEKLIAVYLINNLRNLYLGEAGISPPLKENEEEVWGPLPRYFKDEKNSDLERENQWSYYEQTLFKDEYFIDNTAEIQQLQNSIQGLTTAYSNARFTVIIMPEKKVFRGRIPPIAEEQFKQVLQAAFADREYELHDMRDLLDDSCFRDFSHVNNKGRKQFSEKVRFLWE